MSGAKRSSKGNKTRSKNVKKTSAKETARSVKRASELAEQKARLAAVKAKLAAKSQAKKSKPKRKPVGRLKVDKNGAIRDERGAFVRSTTVDDEDIERAASTVLGDKSLVTEYREGSIYEWSVSFEFEPLTPTDAAHKLSDVLSLPELVYGFVAAKVPCMVLVHVEDDEGNTLGWRSASSALAGRTASMQAIDFIARLLPLRVGNYSANPMVTGFEFRRYKHARPPSPLQDAAS